MGISTASDLQLIQRRVGLGVAAFALREGLVRLFTLASGVALARVLDPEVFGLYAIAWFVVHLFSHFSDVGLGDALVRKPGELAEQDCRTVLTLHISLMAALIVAVYFSAPLAVNLYDLTDENVWLVRAMVVPLFFASLRTVPSVRLERDLRFPALAAVDALEVLVFQSVAVAMALLGGGVWSLVLGAMAGSTTATIATYRLSPWRPRLGISRESLRDLLPYGVPFQLQCFVVLARDNLSPALAGLAFGPAASGYLNWARGVARLPVAVGEGISRVSLPAYARVQNDAESLGFTVREALRWSAVLSFGPLALLMALGPQIVEVIYTDKWLPALPAVYLFGVEAMFASITAVLLPLLQATGRVTKSLLLSTVQASIIWLVALALTASIRWAGWSPLGLTAQSGFLGIAIAYVVGTSASSVLLLWQARRLVHLDLLACVRLPVLAAIVGGVAAFLLGAADRSLLGLALAAVGGMAVYAGALWTLGGRPSFAGVFTALRREEGWPLQRSESFHACDVSDQRSETFHVCKVSDQRKSWL